MYSVTIAYILWFLSGFGALGFHRFYLGKIPTGLLWMFTGGLGMVGSIYDFLTLPGQVWKANLRDAIYGSRFRSGRGRRYSGGVGSDRQDPAAENWRYVDDGRARVVHEKESVERAILRLAKENKGILTVSELALKANVPLEKAKKALDTLVNKGFAELRVRRSGTLVYTVREFMDQDKPLEDF
ncbi:MAG: NINE protein [Treponema sp.]|jgi:TM2 domain-containing membrane protein YozV/predicted transcriptional regulator|nr:NINE protein [Treponema sp.]